MEYTDTRLREAVTTAEKFFNEAINCINHTLGEGYAEKHPELIAAFMQVAVSELNSHTLVKAQSQNTERALER